jgi:hypothetical protein
MKKSIKYFIIIFIMFSAAYISCKKDNTNNSAGTINFSSLVAKDSLITIDSTGLAYAQFTATATGNGLSYTWSCEGGWGTFYGSGPTVNWSICHASKFKITCSVKDADNNSVSKDVYVRSKN